MSNFCSQDEEVNRPLAIQAICKVLHSPEDIVRKMEGDSDKKLSLVTLITHHWAQSVIEKDQCRIPDNSLLLWLSTSSSTLATLILTANQPLMHESRFSDPYWLKVYHALLEWQSLYSNVCSLIAMLCQPLEPLSPSFLFDGPLVIFLAGIASKPRDR